MPKIQIILEASSPAEAKAMMDRAYGELPITDDDIRDYLVRKGWWKPGVENGPQRSADKLIAPVLEIETKDERKNSNPGEPTIIKIGTATVDLLIADLKAGRQPPQPKYTEHLKLLWKRGAVKFDGKEYYL